MTGQKPRGLHGASTAGLHSSSCFSFCCPGKATGGDMIQMLRLGIDFPLLAPSPSHGEGPGRSSQPADVWCALPHQWQFVYPNADETPDHSAVPLGLRISSRSSANRYRAWIKASVAFLTCSRYASLEA